LNLRASAAARSIDAEPTTRNHNIPDVLSSFVGRKEEMPWIEADLGTFRLVTIVGPGGCGKTRLALEIAGRLVDSGKHAWLIDLSPLRDQADVPAAIAQVLGVHEAPPRSLIESIERSIRDKQLTMVVDNCEHLIEEASKVIESLLQGCPNLRVLATSREPLSIAGERVDRIRPLSVPDSNASMLLDDLLQSDAVRLFVDRARAISPEFDLNELTGPHVATVCTRLDGIPLAIELAAAQCKSMSVSEIADGLSDRFALLTAGSRTAPARHRTLEAAIAWSYDLLDHAQQQALAALSVFDGAFTLQAAVAISSSRSVPDDGASSVSSLAECSLLQVEVGRPTRFRLLESVREFAAMRLWAGNAEAVHAVYDRHTNFYLHRYSGRRHEEVTSTASEELGLAETFPHDRADVLTAARRVISRGNLDESDVEFIITAGDGLNSFGEYSLQLELLRGALEASDPDISQLGFARLWHQVALIQTALGKLSEARTLLERAISLLDWEIDPFEYINVLCDLGDIMLQSGNVAGITRVFSLVDQAMERGGPEGVTAQIHPRQSAVPFFRAYFAGASDPDQARDDIKRSLEFHESHGLSTYLDYYLLGSLEAERGNVDDGCRIMYDILDQARALGPSSLQRFLLDLAAFEAVRGHGEKAMDLALEAALIISNTETTGLYANGALKLALALEACGESVGSATAHGAAVNLLTEEVFYPFDERLRLESRTRLESDLGRESFEAAIGVGDLLDFESLADLVRSARDV
jgi:predicted ATPase